jgi:hypothetical protein
MLSKGQQRRSAVADPTAISSWLRRPQREHVGSGPQATSSTLPSDEERMCRGATAVAQRHGGGLTAQQFFLR